MPNLEAYDTAEPAPPDGGVSCLMSAHACAHICKYTDGCACTHPHTYTDTHTFTKAGPKHTPLYMRFRNWDADGDKTENGTSVGRF